MARELSVIASEIESDWKRVNFAARPYLNALKSLTNVSDNYGAEYGDMIVAYFLNNSGSWRGPKAREIKAELKSMLEVYNKEHFNRG